MLGTPEFMAPELYDENYDEKVDIYAFGMCLLEIFTKEVPYHECSNPAQIYKKVTNKIEPESLSKVQISDAQELIRLCINTDPAKRPTAAELMNHSFLGQNATDAETEIIVMDDRALSPIAEKTGNASSTSHATSVSEVTKSMTKSSTAIDIHNNVAQINEAVENVKEDGSMNTGKNQKSDDVLMTDSLSEMQLQENESSMGKSVKALMGRTDKTSNSTAIPTIINANAASDKDANDNSSQQDTSVSDKQQQQQQHRRSESTSSQYIVAAECMEEVVTDNLMKLIISIPIQNETQHVQFDFHLVEDDPVQVAREMVNELHIPQQAILEISETISGLARDARVNQERALQIQRQAVQETDLLSLTDAHAAQEGEASASASSASVGAKTNGAGDLGIKSSSAPNLNEAAVAAAAENNAPMKRNVSAESAQHRPLPQHATVAVAAPGAAAGQAAPATVSYDDEIDLGSEEDVHVEEEELRKIGEDYRKNRERANKAYDTRMDNLKRSKDEKVAQHKKFLEKHEREMDEFDKRLKQAEIDQTKRLEQLENDWSKQREELLESKRIVAQRVPISDGAPQYPSLGGPGQMHVESASTTGANRKPSMLPVKSVPSSGLTSSGVSGADLSLLDR